ncbi:hypothetical protein TRAPUB_6020 [Trametes pubescens]|uniref:4a-hydroxytetrahydrobiopterin dehydratase n=1 Tax=Trametes pubescens TaxID=154538 RepID=A0A1M2V6Y2_TRAPU|nr:hypothetical protein TRAPUB_6020 [Trametes pubescens]
MSGLARQTSDSNTAEPDFPELPPPPPFPCPFLTDDEIATYLGPLYAREWTVQPSDPKATKKPSPELVKRFAFSTFNELNAFLHLDLLDITQSENHHARQDITPDPPSLIVRVHTHSGLRPARHAEEPRRARVQPGITLRDVRFVYLLEQRLAARGGTAAVRSEAENMPSADEQPRSVAAVEARRGLSGQA